MIRPWLAPGEDNDCTEQNHLGFRVCEPCLTLELARLHAIETAARGWAKAIERAAYAKTQSDMASANALASVAIDDLFDALEDKACRS